MTQRTWPKRPNVDLQSSCTDHGADHSADHSAYHGADHGADHDRTGHDPRHLLQAMTGWYQSFLEALVVIPGWVGNYSKLKQYFNYLRILNKKIKFLFHACSTIFFVLGVGGQCLYNYHLYEENNTIIRYSHLGPSKRTPGCKKMQNLPFNVKYD